MKFKWGALLTVLLAVALLATACTDAPASSGAEGDKVYVVAMDASFPPMEFVDENKEIVGFDVDLLTAIAEEMGFEFEIKNTAWDGIFAGLESGDYDVIMSAVTIRADRQEKYDFTDPYINAGQAIVVRADDTEILGPDDLSGRNVGAQIGTTGAFAIQDIAGAILKEYDSADLALLDLVSGNIDAVVVDTPVAADYALLSAQFAGRLKIVGDAITSEEYGALVNKGQNQEFLEMFNEGLSRVQSSGMYDQIYARWISPVE
jgi:polar amino acid transport system substrate-binding protein